MSIYCQTVQAARLNTPQTPTMVINKDADLLHDSSKPSRERSGDAVLGCVSNVAYMHGLKRFKMCVYNLYIFNRENAYTRGEERKRDRSLIHFRFSTGSDGNHQNKWNACSTDCM